MKYQHPFSGMRKLQFDDVPDHLMQTINDICAQILQAALIYNKQQIDSNLAFGGMQKAVAILIGNFFTKETRAQAIEEFHKALIENVGVFSDLPIRVVEE